MITGSRVLSQETIVGEEKCYRKLLSQVYAMTPPCHRTPYDYFIVQKSCKEM